MKSNQMLTLFVGLLMLNITAQAFAANQDLEDILNVSRCTNQWDLMIAADELRHKGTKQEAARKALLTEWVRPDAKAYFNAVLTDAVNGAVDYVYTTDPMPEKISDVMRITHKGFIACINSHHLQRYEKELKSASLNAGLVTMWDNFRGKGYKKEQILTIAKNLTDERKKLLDDVFQPNFKIKFYRLHKIWEPTLMYISEKYHGIKSKK